MRSAARPLLVLIATLCAGASEAGEVLGHISDDTAALAAPSAEQNAEIVYRVVCSPEGERLPDCDRPIQDSWSSPPAPLAEEPQPATAASSSTSESNVSAPQKKPVKHKKTAKKAAKKHKKAK